MDQGRHKLSLFLTDARNEFVSAIATAAEDAARHHEVALTTAFTQNQAVEQIQQIYAALRAPEDERPDAILVMPVHDSSLERVARTAASAGVAWVCLHRATGDLDAIRREFPQVPVCLVGPEQQEIGRIQGRQLRVMLPRGGRVLYVHGRSDNLSTAQRSAGLREVIDGTDIAVGEMIDGNWSTVDAERVLGRWLRLLIAHTQVDAVACQNDAMAIGALRALRAAATAMGRPELREIPVFGCDGLPDVGRKLVDQGQLAGTVVVPTPSSAAVAAVVLALNGGGAPRAEIRLTPSAYPALDGARLDPRVRRETEETATRG